MPKFVKNTLITSLARVIQLALGVGASIIVARSLGPEGKGIYSLVFLFEGVLVNFLDFGIGSATVFNIGKKKYSPREALGANIFLSTAISLASIIIGSLIIIFLGSHIFPGIPSKYLFLGLVLAPFYFYLNYIVSIMLGLQKIKLYNLLQSAVPLFFFLLLLLLLLLRRIDVVQAVFAQIAAYALAVVVAFVVAKKNSGGISFPSGTAIYKSAISYGIKNYIGNIITFFQYRANVFLINIFLNPLAVGFYSVAAGLVEQMWIVSEAAGAMLFPRVAGESDKKNLDSFTPRVCRNVMFITLIACIFLFFIGPYLIGFFYSSSFSDSIAPFKILLAGIVAMSGWRILSSDFYGRGLPMINTYISAASVAVSIALNIVLIPQLGIIGAAWATSISYIASFLMILLVYRKISGNRIRDVLFMNGSDIVYYKRMMSNFKNMVFTDKKNELEK